MRLFDFVNPAVHSMRRYIALVRPWAGNQWFASDFDDAAMSVRLDPSHIVFPIPTRPMPGMLEQVLLGPERADALVQLMSWVDRFNATNRKMEMTAAPLRGPEMTMLHVGLIGSFGTMALYDAFRSAERLVAR